MILLNQASFKIQNFKITHFKKVNIAKNFVSLIIRNLVFSYEFKVPKEAAATYLHFPTLLLMKKESFKFKRRNSDAMADLQTKNNCATARLNTGKIKTFPDQNPI